MRILIVNPPHPAIGSRIPREQLPPLGLLCVGGPLIDAGHDVTLLDAEIGPLSHSQIVKRAIDRNPQVILIGHSGSTSAHPIVAELTRSFRTELPNITIVYGGVFPTYHFREILAQEQQIDIVVRGEGEATLPKLIAAIEDINFSVNDLDSVDGIAFRRDGQIVETAPATAIEDLDSYRVGWELIDHQDYSYYGGKRAVVMQFSRGCPHLCNYCGQRGFWARWRHRDPQKFAKEIAWLHRNYGVELINLADENPTVNKAVWRELCEAIVAENINITIIGSTRADDIVRDADILHLYRKAGVERFFDGDGKHRRSYTQKNPQRWNNSVRSRGNPLTASAWYPISSNLGDRFRRSDRSGFHSLFTAVTFVRSRPNYDLVCHSTPLDWIFPN